jgi:hypothetical protein
MQGAPFLTSFARSGARPPLLTNGGDNVCMLEQKKLNRKIECRSDVRTPRLENHKTWDTLA